ncbi:MAG: isoprenylcysteine carboxylmethyltransferase family protein [Candidatus Omnitrophica bacterium]|nr:isoprenylcysteine carboxylmethyltransferase family protein [Candidatus Omnitrophota bacterium]
MFDPQKFRPPHVVLILITSATILHILLKPLKIIPSPYHWFGLIDGVFGFALMMWAHQLFVKGGTPVRHNEQPMTIVTQGPYKYSRNPMYIGGLVMLGGMAVFIGTRPFLLFPFMLFIVLDRVFIPWEEQRMTELFGEEFRQYCESVPRWL